MTSTASRWLALALRADLAPLTDLEVLRAANLARHCGRDALADACCDELRRRADADPGVQRVMAVCS